jgi:hypothetical protein
MDLIAQSALRWFAPDPLFAPEHGTVVREPESRGPGWWVGAPSAIFDPERRRFYLYYRQRRPLTEGRGWRIAVAESADGIRFSEIWHATKEQFQSSSIERSCILKTPDGRYRLYVSYVAMPKNRWRIDMLEADEPRHWDPSRRITVLEPETVDAEGVKDPVVFLVGQRTYMFVPYGPRSSVAPGSTEAELHGTGNVFTLPRIKHPSGLAVSEDGVGFRWLGDATLPGRGWDRQMARVSCVLHTPPLFQVFYDGRTGEGDVYEDRTGLYVTHDLRTFHKLTPDGPILQSPHGQGCLRYLDAVEVGKRLFFYYEYGRPDGGHELRVSVVERRGMSMA